MPKKRATLKVETVRHAKNGKAVFTKIIELPPAGERVMSINFHQGKQFRFIKMLPSKSQRKKHWKKVRKDFAIWLKTHSPEYPYFTTKSDGTDIGLSMSHRIVTDHGGSLTVLESDLGGAEFRIKIPITRQVLDIRYQVSGAGDYRGLAIRYC